MDKVTVDIKQAGAIISLMSDMVIPDLVVECACFGHGFQVSRKSGFCGSLAIV
jgi:hypothetical protein